MRGRVCVKHPRTIVAHNDQHKKDPEVRRWHYKKIERDDFFGVVLMKGSPQAPQCGFSAQTVQCLISCGERFAYVDILSNPEIRTTLPSYSNWPTFPQLYVGGELVGGCDIITEMFEAGELETLIKETAVAG